MISKHIFSDVQTPKTAEEYCNLGYTERFSIQMKLINDDYLNGTNIFSETIKLLDKPMYKKFYFLYDKKKCIIIGKYESLDLISKDNEMSIDIISYLNRVQNKKEIKNPKFQEYYLYDVYYRNMKLSGNEYV